MKATYESKCDEFFPQKTENIWQEYYLFIALKEMADANSENQKKKRLQQPNNEGNNSLSLIPHSFPRCTKQVLELV